MSIGHRKLRNFSLDLSLDLEKREYKNAVMTDAEAVEDIDDMIAELEDIRASLTTERETNETE